MTLVEKVEAAVGHHTAPSGGGTGETLAQFVFAGRCSDQPGVVHAVTKFLLDQGCNIKEHQQFDDPVRQVVHLRTAFTGSPELNREGLEQDFSAIAERFGMDYEFHDPTPPRLLVMVSKSGHCLNDLIFRWRAGGLGGEIALVVSNHDDLRPMAEAAGLPYLHIPVSAETKDSAEQQLLDLVEEHRIDLVVLARYMQILSDEVCARLAGRIINIHHSFLPSFMGARPYHQAWERGVKIIGATAHYATADLDEGPIIDQDVARVSHAHTPQQMQVVGRDLERVVLSRAVRAHAESRVFLLGHRTVVFT